MRLGALKSLPSGVELLADVLPSHCRNISDRRL
jgi:hypothetical protein